MTKVGLLYDPLYLWHDTGAHPESALRLTAIMHVLTEAGLTSHLVPLRARDATVDEIAMVHDRRYIDYVREMAERGGAWADPDTYISPRSYDAALRASGGACRLPTPSSTAKSKAPSAWSVRRATTRCPTTRWASAFSTTSPLPPDTPFACVAWSASLSSTSTSTTATAPRPPSTRPVGALLLDAPVPVLPGYRPSEEIGDGAGRGYNVNVPLPAGCGDDEYRRVFGEALEPLLNRYRPQLILVSAGYDGHFNDPLASMRISVAGYAEMMSFLRRKAAELCEGRLVCVLEGGYHLLAEAWSVRACLEVLLGETPAQDPFGKAPESAGCQIDRVLSAVKSLHGLTVSPQSLKRLRAGTARSLVAEKTAAFREPYAPTARFQQPQSPQVRDFLAVAFAMSTPNRSLSRSSETPRSAAARGSSRPTAPALQWLPQRIPSTESRGAG